MSKAVDCESIRDLGLLAWCETIVLIKMADYATNITSQDPMTLKPDPVSLGLRLLLYRKELEPWRDKHPVDMKVIDAVSRTADFAQAMKYIMESVDRLMQLIPK